MNLTSFVVLWLALMGQGQQVNTCKSYYSDLVEAAKSGCTTDYAPSLQAVGGSGEHVIEIRTKREPAHERPVLTNDGDICPNSDRHERCERWQTYYDTNQRIPGGKCIEKHIWCGGKTVKTLWIDNQRIGVIREVEEK